MADAWLKNPPNNLNLADPSEQSRTNDLIGARDTQPVRRFAAVVPVTKADSLPFTDQRPSHRRRDGPRRGDG